MSRVFLIAQPTVARAGGFPKLDGLDCFGEVIVLLPAGIHPWRDPKKVMDKFHEKLRGFDPDKDMIVWAGGDTLSALMIGYLLSELDITRITWLKWQRIKNAHNEWQDEGGYYEPMKITLAEIRDTVEDFVGVNSEEDDHGE